jgi:hypothetical protein
VFTAKGVLLLLLFFVILFFCLVIGIHFMLYQIEIYVLVMICFILCFCYDLFYTMFCLLEIYEVVGCSSLIEAAILLFVLG